MKVFLTTVATFLSDSSWKWEQERRALHEMRLQNAQASIAQIRYLAMAGGRARQPVSRSSVPMSLVRARSAPPPSFSYYQGNF